MKKWPLAWAVTGLALARLIRTFSSSALPDPSPLPVSVMQRIPETIVVPAHDQRAYAEMARLPNVTTKGLLL